MTQPRPSFGDLRSALHRPPDASAWALLCELLERWPHDDPALDALVLPYALAQLKRWPDALRQRPRRWLELALADQPAPSYGLSRCLALPRAGLDDSALTRLCQGQALQGLTLLDLRFNWLRERGAAALARCDALASCRELLLSFNQLTDRGLHALGHSHSHSHSHSHAQRQPLAQLERLELARNDLSDLSTATFLSAPFSPSLRALSLSANWIGPSGTHTLAQSPLTRLESLDLSHNQLTDLGVAHLTNQDARLIKLKKLNLSHNGLTSQAARSLAWIRPTTHLVFLSLSENRIGAQGLHYLAESSRLRSLQTLELERAQLPDEALWALAETPHLAQLQTLSMADNLLGAEGMEILALAPRALPSLSHLSLANNGLGDEGLLALTAWPGVAKLHSLNLHRNLISARGARALMAATSLRRLHLSQNPLGDDAVEALAALLPSLEVLDLRACGLTAHGVAALTRSPHLGRLRVLRLGHNDLRDEGALALARCQALTGLTCLDLHHAQIDEHGWRALRQNPHLSHALRPTSSRAST